MDEMGDPKTAREWQARQDAKVTRVALQRKMISSILRQDIDHETKVDLLMDFMDLPVTCMIELWLAVHGLKPHV